MKKLKKQFFILLGFMAVALGAIGALLPFLPTTPFLLLALFCFSKGSEKWNRWFTGTRLYKKHLESFVTTRAMTLKQKIFIIIFVNTMMAIPFIMVDSIVMRIGIVVLLVIKFYYFIFKIKTIRHRKEKRSIDTI